MQRQGIHRRYDTGHVCGQAVNSDVARSNGRAATFASRACLRFISRECFVASRDNAVAALNFLCCARWMWERDLDLDILDALNGFKRPRCDDEPISQRSTHPSSSSSLKPSYQSFSWGAHGTSLARLYALQRAHSSSNTWQTCSHWSGSCSASEARVLTSNGGGVSLSTPANGTAAANVQGSKQPLLLPVPLPLGPSACFKIRTCWTVISTGVHSVSYCLQWSFATPRCTVRRAVV